MAALSSTDDPQAAGAASVPDVAGSDASAEPAAGSRTRGKDARAGTTQEEQPAAPPAEESEPEVPADAMVAALLLPAGETWCTVDGTPYRAQGGQPVYVRQRHVAELTARGATEPERAADSEPAAG